MHGIQIDFERVTGRIKPMHSVNNAPTIPGRQGRDPLYEKMQEAGIPYSRLHDTGGRFGGARHVDVPNVFPDPDADAGDPSNYDFAFTDELMRNLIRHSIQPFYRLGVTIENYQYIKPYGVIPPKDPHQWARICEGIIKHYTQGWADGFEYDIEYWEIWNEPDNEPEPSENPMWQGTAEQFFRLYEVASNYLKGKFPHLKFGGYGSCGFYALSDDDCSATAKSTSRVGYFVEFFHDFMKYITSDEHRSPLDFFSWHSYAETVQTNIDYADYAKEQLRNYGFGDIEIFLNEWSPGVRWRGKAKEASLVAAMMCAMQKSASVDHCMYYDAQISSSYGGLFWIWGDAPTKTYYALKAFGALYRLQQEVFSHADGEGLYVAAAKNQKGAASLLLVNDNDYPIEVNVERRGLDVASTGSPTLYLLDQEHDLTPVGDEAIPAMADTWMLTLPANSLALCENLRS